MTDYITELRAWANARVKEHTKTLSKPTVREVLGRYESKSASGVTYMVERMGNKIVCNCPGYVYRQRCKHAEIHKNA
jgi:hypothetical protein